MVVVHRAPIHRNFESFSLVWLSVNGSHNVEKSRTIRFKLRQVINDVQRFENKEECIDYIKRIEKEKVILIISNASTQDDILSQIHDWPQLFAVYLTVDDDTLEGQTVDNYQKVREHR